MPFCNCYSDEDQNVRLGNEVRNWKILLKAVTQNNKSSRRFPRIQLDRDMWFRLFLRILVFVSCVTIPESDLFFHFILNCVLLFAFKNGIAHQRVYGAF